MTVGPTKVNILVYNTTRNYMIYFIFLGCFMLEAVIYRKYD